MSDRLIALLALTLLAACNTYNDSLLKATLDPNVPADGGGSGSAGDSSAALGGDAGAPTEPALGGGGYGGEPAAQAGEANNAGSPGSGGSLGGEPGAGGRGGSVASAGSAGMSSAGASNGPVGDQIDDFEDQDAFILRLSMRNGPWYVVADTTATGTTGPSMTIGPLATADLRPNSTGIAALHLAASGFTDWGAGVGADMVNQMAKKAPYDISAYRGIRFYAKVGSGSTSTVKVLLPNTYSDADGGKCSDLVTTKRCGDHLFKSVSGLKTTWDVYQVNFSDLTQQAFGLPQTTIDLTGVYSIQFTLANKLPIDLWIDDVSFVP